MKRILILTAVLVFIAGMSGSALAKRGSGFGAGRMDGPGRLGHDGFGGRSNILSCQKELGLSEDQVAKIQNINFAHQNLMVDFKADLEKAHLKMRQARQTDDATKTSILAIAKDINAIKGKLAEARINHQFDLKAVLSPEQLEKWKQHRMESRGKRGPGMDQRRDGFRRGLVDSDKRPFRGEMRRDGSRIRGI